MKAIPAMLLFAACLSLSSPAQFPLPANIAPYLGDASRGAEPEARFRESHPKLPEEIAWPINQGNPFTEYGHFRLSRAVIHGRTGQALLAPDDLSDPAALAERYENIPWKDGRLLRLSVLRPPEDAARPAGGWPVVFLFPGAGGTGQERLPRNRVEDAHLWAGDWHRRHLPAHVVQVHPQIRPVNYTAGGALGVETTAAFAEILAVLEHFAALPDTDAKRLYAIGHSMGGTTVWQVMLARPGLLAAAVPNAGQPPARAEDYARLGNTPVWMIMGHNDPWVGSSSYTWAYGHLRRAGHTRVRYWEVQDIGHSGGVIRTAPIHLWMFGQRRP